MEKFSYMKHFWGGVALGGYRYLGKVVAQLLFMKQEVSTGAVSDGINLESKEHLG